MTLWNKLAAVGLEHTHDPVEERHTRMLNVAAMVIILWIASAMTGSALVFDFPFPRELVLTAALFASGWFMVFPLNHFGWFGTARVWSILTSLVYTVLNSILMGPDSLNHLGLFLIVVAAFIAFPSRQRAWSWGFSAASIAAFYALQSWFRTHDGWLTMPLEPTDFANTTVIWLFIANVLLHVHNARVVERAEADQAAQKQRADDLLANMLPKSIINRMKAGETTIADWADATTLLFADLVGFTELSQRIPAEELVDLLNRVFSRFDTLAAGLGIEKIKTIGDAYMAVVGVPDAREDHAQVMAMMALGMQQAIAEVNEATGHHLNIRIGLHTGPVVAGVIGQSKFAYDLWGDTVNTAARMESHGLPGRIQVSGAVQPLLERDFVLEPRGTIDVKGKGRMETWFLTGSRTG